MSAAPPIETTVEKPISCDFAQSKIAVHTAPDCESNAKFPSLIVPSPKVAFKNPFGRATPKQFGPIKRML